MTFATASSVNIEVFDSPAISMAVDGAAVAGTTFMAPDVGDDEDKDNEAEEEQEKELGTVSPDLFNTFNQGRPIHATLKLHRSGQKPIHENKKNAAPLGAAVIATLNHITRVILKKFPFRKMG